MSLRALLVAPLFLLVSALPAAAAGPSVWGESPMVKVLPDAAPRAQASVHITAARNEFVSFQVGLHGGDTGLRGVRASLPSLDGPASIQGADLTLYRQDFVTTRRASVPDESVGRWPDALVPDVDEIAGEARNAFPFDVPAREARALWIDVHVPLDAPPGDYQGTVKVTGDGVHEDVAVRLTVVDAVLPSTPSLATAFLAWPPHLCRAHFGGRTDCSPQELEPLLSRYQRMALEHRITLSSAFPRVPGASGRWDMPDLAAFDATWGPFLDGTAPSRLPGARMTSIEYLGEYTPQALTDFVSHFRERGWLSRAYAYVGDEPPYGNSWDEIRQNLSVVNQAAPELRTLLTTSIQDLKAQHLEDELDLIAPLVNYMDGAEPPYLGDQREQYTGYLATPERTLWMYQSCMSHGCAYGTNAPENKPGSGWPSYMLDRSAAKARAMEWATFLEGATGELYYQTVGMLASAWEDQFRFNGNGDGTLFYPGTVQRIGGDTQVPVASLRLKLIRLGVQDYEWLKMVSDAGDPDFARQVARELIPAASQVSDDGAAFERARLRLIQRYLELSGARDGQAPAVKPGGDEARTSGCGATGGSHALAGVLALVGLALAPRKRPHGARARP
ncbi:DUF4091 domain-containing protein [Archangium primigenium]|uniref:DUF4091 domain-containing protein n=1 Tax=[Archangium] primigenium TaxID=2792470 RepID=UPI0019593360|nr:DUF4091 domain-containing protein [Archangium primigenium]MBM7113937.1 DUF4091 domain-containing protein [Archangium primigenium]